MKATTWPDKDLGEAPALDGPEPLLLGMTSSQINALNSNLYILLGRIWGGLNKVDAEVLINSEADRIYVSLTIAKQMLFDSRYEIQPLEITLPNRQIIWSTVKLVFHLKINSFRQWLEAWIMELQEHDLILRLTWLKTTNPQINWATGCMTVRDWQRKHYHLFPKRWQRAVNRSTLNVIGGRTAMKALWKRRTVGHLLVVWQNLKESGAELPTVMDEWLWVIIEKFWPVFRLTLPDELPPKWVFKHSIDTGDANPININAYPLSQLQLDEQAKQVAELLDKGLICEYKPMGLPSTVC